MGCPVSVCQQKAHETNAELTDTTGVREVGNEFAVRKTLETSPAVEPHVRDVQGLNDLPAIHDDVVIEYLTDIEGNWEYLLNFVSKSEILHWIGDPRGVWGPGELAIKPFGILVFGGDAPDKGPGDIRIVKTLTRLKLQHPSQVFIVLGNRDLIKLRFRAELASGDENLDNPWLPTWEKEPKPLSDFLAKEGLEKNRINKLKWMLECNMGCQGGTFSTRKTELAYLAGTASDEHVLRSYTDSVDPESSDPWMLEFLRAGVLALVLNDTLFVHGGLQDESAGHVPGHDSEFRNVHEWVAALNAWKEEELLEFEKDPWWRTGSDGQKTRGGAALIQYGTPGAGNKTVIYYNPFDNGNPVKRTEKVQRFLDESGIRCMISGHQPHGQTPTVVRHTETGLLVITADTSRSDSNGSKVFNPLNNRGLAISIVRLHGDHVIVKGETNEGKSHGFTLNRRDSSKDEMPNALVGRQLISNAWVKTVIIEDGIPRLIVAHGVGWKVSIEVMSIQRACMNLTSEYRSSDNFLVKLREVDADQLLECPKPLESCYEDMIDTAMVATVVANNRSSRLMGSAMEAFTRASTYVFSFNGVLMDPNTKLGAKIIDNINTIIFRKKRVVFITNDSTMSRDTFFRRLKDDFNIDLLEQSHSKASLQQAGMKSDASVKNKADFYQRFCVITTAFTCAWYCKQHGSIRRPFVITHGTGLLEELKQQGITDYFANVDEKGKQKTDFAKPVSAANVQHIINQAPDVDAIIVGWDLNLSALSIAVAENFIRWNQELAAETDGKAGGRLPIITCSGDVGGIVGRTTKDCLAERFQGRKVRTAGNGMMTQAIFNRPDMKHHPIDVGKPSQMFVEHLSRGSQDGGMGVDFSNAVMIGDSLGTDVKMANRCGMRSLLVLSGVTSQEMVDKEERPDYTPTWVVESFAAVGV